MIEKIQRKFILTAMLAVVLVTFIIAGTINLANYIRSDSQTDYVLELISENDGSFPEYGYVDINDIDNEVITQETEHSTRYFSFKVSDDGKIFSANMMHIAMMTEDSLESCLKAVDKKDKTTGYYDQYKYLVTSFDGYRLIVFLDCTDILQETRSLAVYSSLIMLAVCVIIFFVVTLYSKKAINPLIESIDKQKQFITNAGHELKTPVAIILANADVLEMKNGKDDEWVASIKKQAARLDTLIKNLLKMAKIDEIGSKPEFCKFSVSEMADEIANSFMVVANGNGNNIEKIIAEQIEMNGDKDSIHELFSILLDNAVKYVSPGGGITVSLGMQGKFIRLEVSNDHEYMDKVDCSKLFDRFYRSDTSRARKTGGYGIGLSMAATIVKIHNGKISAGYYDGRVHIIALLKP